MKRRLTSFVILMSFMASNALAITKLEFSHDHNISKYKGKTFLHMMEDVKASADELATDGFKLGGDVETTLSGVVAKVAKKYVGANFSDSKSAAANIKANQTLVDNLGEMSDALAKGGKVYRYDDVDNACGTNMSKFSLTGSKYSVGMFMDMVAGAGVSVQLDKDNYFFNVGYDSNDEKNIQTGRSFAAGPTHLANDASDVNYLNDLESYFKKDKEQEKFYRVMMQIITNNDASGLKGLKKEGQSLMSDLIAVYTAESLRHMMVKLSPKTAVWEWDLAAATLVSMFNVETGYMMKAKDPTNPNADISLMKAPLRDHWTMNPETKRSGIGKTKKARQMLSKAITAYEMQHNKAVVTAIADIVGSRAKTDAIQATVEFLSNNDTPDSLGSDAAKLTEAMVKFIVQVKKDAKAIKDDILASQGRAPLIGEEQIETTKQQQSLQPEEIAALKGQGFTPAQIKKAQQGLQQ